MKRFYTKATTNEAYALLLDSKPVQTPAKNPLLLPNNALAQAVVAEWNLQGDVIDKATLPLTGMASLAIDIALLRRAELIEELLEYGETDLMFYRAGEEDLAADQHRQWQPWIKRAQVAFGTRYAVTQSVLPVAQPEGNRSLHREKLETLNHWQLALLAAVVKPTTSLLLGWFFVQGELDAVELFSLSQREEAYNAERWGEDAEAKQKAESLRSELETAQRWREGL